MKIWSYFELCCKMLCWIESPDSRNTFFKKLIYFNWRLITLQYCGGFRHMLTWISHGCTDVPPSWIPLPPPSTTPSLSGDNPGLLFIYLSFYSESVGYKSSVLWSLFWETCYSLTDLLFDQDLWLILIYLQ